MATGTTEELTEIQCVTAKVQEVKDKVHAMQSLPHQRVCGLQRKCSTNKRRDNCGFSADHIV